MKSYRFARRTFLAGVGGAVGLKAMLSNVEAAAAGSPSPPRFLLTHWASGTLRHHFVPSAAGADYVPGPITKPFEDAGLRGDMTIFYGFSDGHLSNPGGGGHEAGTPYTTTCCSGEGTRQNGGEADDAVAGGPSFDQVFLRRVPALAARGYVNAICDARVDSSETSTRCLSYGYTRRPVESARGGTITEHEPLLPELEPAKLYALLFSNFMPGGATPENQADALMALRLRRSVLDYSLSELGRLERLSPASEREKLQAHADAIRKLELQLSGEIAGSTPGECVLPSPPSPTLVGKTGNVSYQMTAVDDSVTHQAVAAAHQAIILAAFQCDLIRVATFQFTPGSNHVGFGGLWPNDPLRIAEPYSTSRAGSFLATASQADPATLNDADRDRYLFLSNVHAWYSQRMADWLKKLKETTDVLGGKLLDHTLVPYVTEVADSSNRRSPKPAILFGGSKLGVKHGTFQNFTPVRRQVDLYLTCAQALLQTADPLSALGDERFTMFNSGAAPIADLWSPPS